MAQYAQARDVRASTESGSRALTARRLERLLLGDVSTLQLVLIAGPLVLAGAWLLVAPSQVLSRGNTWDLLFNLSGAWRLLNGQVPHVDFHDPLGSLGFWLTRVGFAMVGPSPRAFLVGELIVLAVAFVTAVIAASRRLPPIPAVLFVLYVALLVLMPANVGNPVNIYSFAMSYNRWGWSALTTLCLLLFLPPRPARHAAWLDAVTSGLLLFALFYLKITLALAGFAAVSLALVASAHVRAHWRMWAVAVAVVPVNAAAPINYPYLSDIGHAATSGYLRAILSDQVRIFFINGSEYALYGSAVLMLLWLWRRGQAEWQSVLFAAFVLSVGVFVLSQNAQQRNIPVNIVILFLLYDAVRRHLGLARVLRLTEVAILLAAILTWPAVSVASALTTLIGYHRAATRDTGIVTVDTTNLRGLAVQDDDRESAGMLATVDLPYQLNSSTREPPLEDQISQAEYVQTVLEAASLFAGGQRGQAKIMVLDQVNPMPFVLGYPPPRGGHLWFWIETPPRSGDEIFGDVDVVLIPKLSTYARTTAMALATYQDYLSTHFPVQEQSRSWTLLSRR